MNSQYQHVKAFWFLLQQKMMEKTGTFCAKLQSKNHQHQQTNIQFIQAGCHFCCQPTFQSTEWHKI